MFKKVNFMNNRIIIIVLSSIIVIQMIAGVFILRRDNMQGPPFPPFGFIEDKMTMGPGMGKRHMMGNRFGRSFCEPEFMKEKLSLNQNQIEKITELNKKFDAEFTGYIKQIEPEREKLKSMLDSRTDDMDAVKKQLTKIQSIDVEIHLLRIKQGKEISGILSPDQMKILHDERKMFFDKMQKNHGGMR
jgi:Spy/CpxP family protein refolding chaperone